MRVLVATLPLWGHLRPLLPLASALVSRGHEVMWATGPDACARVEGLGFRAVPAGLTEEDFNTARDAGQRRFAHLPPEERPNWLAPWIFGSGRAGPMLHDLRELVADWPPDLVVHDQAEYASAIVAGTLGIPHVSHGFGDVLPTVRVARTGDDVAGLWRAAGLTPRPYGGSYDHLYLDIYPPGLAMSPRDHISRRQLIRPVPPFGAVPGPLPGPLRHLTDRSLVYATLGTVFNDPRLLASVVGAVASLPVSVVATVGFDIDPAAYGDQPEHVHLARFVPQDDLLPHCAAVVSHGGSGTFLAALAHGLPQVLVPQGADQFLNAAAAERAGVAIVLRGDQQDPDRIRQAVSTVLEDQGFAARAALVAEEIAAMPSADQVVDRLDDLLR